MRSTAFVALLLLTAACKSPTDPGIDLTHHQPIPELHELDYAGMQPAEAWNYWELRFWMEGSASDSIIGGAGEMPRAALAPAVLMRLDAARPREGFAIGCLPAYCFHYIAAVRGEEVTTVATVAALRSFLGPLDSVDEAALLVRAMGYWWGNMQEVTGYRALAAGGWSFVVLQMVAFCVPVQTDRVVLHVARDGTVTEQRRELWHKLDDACV